MIGPHATHEPGVGQIRVAEILGALSLASDLGIGQPMGHLLRACVLAMRIADQLELSPAERTEVYYVSLLAHAGCTAGAPQFAAFIAADELVALRDMCLCDPSNMGDLLGWLGRNVAPQAPFPARAQHVLAALLGGETIMGDVQRGCSEVGGRIALRLGMPQRIHEALNHICETWNGKGPHHLRGEQIPLPTRIVNAAVTIEVFFNARGRAAAETAARQRAGKSFDPRVVEAFLQAAGDAALWETLAVADLWETALSLEPLSSYQYVGEAVLDEVARAFADFIDLKSAHTATHSRATAQLAEAMAQRMGLPSWEVDLARRAALVHDLGLVAVASFVLDRDGPLSAAEQEQFRLHPHLTERILARVGALRPIAKIAALHHEWLNGQGYPQGLAGADLPMTARVLAVADAFQELTEGRSGRPGVSPKDALNAMHAQVGSRFDGACVEALAQEIGLAATRRPARKDWPAGLTEREVEVVRQLGQGRSNRQIAQQLSLSEKTVAHHLDHIYSKVERSSRAGAIFWAMEHGLLA